MPFRYCIFLSQDVELVLCDACDRAFHMSCADPPMNRTPRGRWVCDICDPSKRAQPDEPPRTPRLPDVLAPGQTCVLTLENERRLCPPQKVPKKRQHSIDATATATAPGAAARATPLHSTDTHASSSSTHAAPASVAESDQQRVSGAGATSASASAPSEKKRARRGGLAAANLSLPSSVLERGLSASPCGSPTLAQIAAAAPLKNSPLAVDTAKAKRAPSLDEATVLSTGRKPFKKRKSALSPSARLSQSSSVSSKAKAHPTDSLSPELHSSRTVSITGASESHLSGVSHFDFLSVNFLVITFILQLYMYSYI